MNALTTTPHRQDEHVETDPYDGLGIEDIAVKLFGRSNEQTIADTRFLLGMPKRRKSHLRAM